MIGLPSLRALDGAQGARISLAAEATDMRCGFDRLAERVRAVIGQDPLTNQLFVFRSRRGDRLKILAWDRDGFVLWYKRSARSTTRSSRTALTRSGRVGRTGSERPHNRRLKPYRRFEQAREYGRSLELKTTQEWFRYRRAGKLPATR